MGDVVVVVSFLFSFIYLYRLDRRVCCSASDERTIKIKNKLAPELTDDRNEFLTRNTSNICSFLHRSKEVEW